MCFKKNLKRRQKKHEVVDTHLQKQSSIYADTELVWCFWYAHNDSANGLQLWHMSDSVNWLGDL